MQSRIVCFGDSNTYGYDPRDYCGGRLEKAVRWTGRLDALADWEILNFGLDGREIPHTEAELRAFEMVLARSAPFAVLTVMLGTNDLFQMPQPDAEKITARMETLLRRALAHPAMRENGARLLLLAPPALDLCGGAAEQRLSECALQLGERYRALAARLAISFADAGAWGITLSCDGVHFSEAGHAVFARRVDAALHRLLDV